MSDDQNPKPDPAAAAAIAKAKRLMLLTMGTTFIALAIVLMFIGYRVFNAAGSPPAPSADRLLPLPVGAKVLSSSVSDDHISVTVEIAGAAEILMFDRKTMKPAGRIQLKPAP